MRKIILGIGAAVLVTGLAPGRATAQQTTIRQDNTPYGTTAAEFLLMAPTARGAALGASFAALTTDVSAMYYNPAGLAQLARPGLVGSSMSYIADTRLSWVGFAIPFGGSRALGFQITTFGFSDQPVYTVDDPEGTTGEVYSVSETALGFTYAQQFSDRFAAGINAKYINDALGKTTGRAFALDFGTNFHALVGGRALRASFVIQHLGTTIQHTGNALDATVIRTPPSEVGNEAQEAQPARLQSKSWSLPVIFRVGLSYDVFTTAASRLTMLGEFTQPNNTDPGFNFAGEYNLGLGSSGFSVAGRVGYTSSPDNNLDPPGASQASYAGFDSNVTPGSDGLSAGGGLRWQRNPRGLGVGFDYAYRNLGLLGNANMITVSLSW
ncbi:MAG: PorV/PorQ family protein [Gemmatimonadetes bacterium]|nr:PorV/PorQ family protein [Gemmatimonadota bacterium]